MIMKRLFILLFATGVSAQAQAQELPRWNIKTNLLWDATATLNIGAELPTGGHMSIDLPLNYNAWTGDRDRKWKHVGLQPELRWWPRVTFAGHFFGVHLHGAHYNVGGWPTSDYMRTHRFEGWLGAAGVSYGYRWNFSRRWAMEATVGLGYAYLSHDIYECGHCGEKIGAETKNYFGPTRAGLSLIVGLGRVREPALVPVYFAPPPPPKVVVVHQPRLTATFVIPLVEEVKARSASGTAYLDFAVGRSEIVESFRGNAVELRRIHATIENVKNDPDATITAISIVGHASPESLAAYNQALSERRAVALRDHIRTIYGLHSGMFSAWGAGEDWATLDSLVASSSLADKYRALEVIRSGGDPDKREWQLKKLPAYRQILSEFYPRLRRSDYTIKYTVVPFTIERGKEVLRTRPMNLSLNEMMLIVNTYPIGSAAYIEVFEIAARIFPTSDVANLNASAIALGRGDIVSAAHHLSRVNVRSEAYWNNAGFLAWLQGDKARAAEHFARGGADGARNAAELRKVESRIQ